MGIPLVIFFCLGTYLRNMKENYPLTASKNQTDLTILFPQGKESR
jgi:hypothetical protein